jgi:hypothetical protein
LLGNGLLATGDPFTSAMQSFRAADRQVGGGHLYATVVKYLHAEVAPKLFGVDHDSDGRLVFTAAAALTEMDGWRTMRAATRPPNSTSRGRSI